VTDELSLIKELTIDLNSERNYFLKPLRFTEGDKAGLKVYIKDNKVDYPHIRFASARLQMRFPSGFEYSGEMEKKYTAVEGELPEDDGILYMFGEETMTHGPVYCRVQLISGLDTISTQSFTIVFDPA